MNCEEKLVTIRTNCIFVKLKMFNCFSRSKFKLFYVLSSTRLGWVRWSYIIVAFLWICDQPISNRYVRKYVFTQYECYVRAYNKKNKYKLQISTDNILIIS